MELLATQIFIIFGLLFSTLVAALLPLFCLKLSTRSRRRLERRNTGDGAKRFWSKLWKCHQDSYPVNHETKIGLENESLRTTRSQTRRAKSRSKMIISVLNCFAGGIFLGTSFVGLLPEIRESFENFHIKWPKLTNHDSGVNGTDNGTMEDLMPVAEMVVVGGLFFILCVEQAAHSVHHCITKRKTSHRGNSVDGLRMSGMGNEDGMERGERRMQRGISEISQLSNDSSESKPQHDHSGIRSLMLVATLSAHSLLEGIPMGLREDIPSILTIFVAVLFHKSLMAFSMGTNLVHGKQTVPKLVAAAIIFALATPIGIAVGLIIKYTGGNSHATALANTILQAIATGTFLYITFFEVLVKEFEAHGNRLAKVLSLFAGYGVILASFFAQHG